MALFSRRPKNDPVDPAERASAAAPDDAATDVPAVSPDTGEAPAEAVPQVSISVSTYRGAGAPAPTPRPAPAPAAPAEAPAQTETVPGLRDNVLLRDALAQVSEKPQPNELINVLRQLLQNHVFLRVRGNARDLLAEGKDLPLSIARNGDDQYVLAFSSGAALRAAVQADGDTESSALGQPALSVISHVLAGPYAGLLLDPASGPKRALIPRALLEQAVNEADPQLRIKTLLAESPRTPDLAARVVAAMPDAKLWVAVNRAPGEEEGSERVGIAEMRTNDGARLLELYSHPLEIAARGRGDRALPFRVQQLAKALADHEEVAGVVIDAAGPWIRLTREDLAPIIALADQVAPEA